MFKDGSWFYKVFVGGLFVALSAIALGIPFILGYQIKHVRNMIEKKEDTLPEWKKMGTVFRDGIAVLCAVVIYVAVMLAAAFVAGAAFSTLPLAIATSIALFFWLPLIIIQYAKTPTLFACFNLVTLVAPVVKRPSAFATAMGISFAVITAVFAFGWMSLIIGWPFIIFWGITVQTHVVGELARLT